MTSASSGGTSGRSVVSGTGVVSRIIAKTSPMFSPSKGVLPVRSSYATTPNDQMSDRGSLAFDFRICSGAM